MRTRLTVLGLILLVAAPSGAVAEEPERRIALVLSGGGSRGLAHIGVLEMLEQLRVPVDVVVGTSMGAVVGGLYAAGRSPEELRRLGEDTDWGDLFTDAPPRRDISFRRKQDDDRSLFGFELGVGAGGFVLPEGLIAGQKLGFLLRSQALPAERVEDFDDLPLPFRAVATDLETGELVVLEHGSLADAIRASMAVPGVFTPVELDGRTLVDGGLVRNLPVDVAYLLGATHVIAVDVSTPPAGVEGRSVVGVALRTVAVVTDRNVRQQRGLLGADDVLIEPDLAGMSSTDFREAERLVELGREATRAQADALTAWSVDVDTWQERVDARRRFLRAGDDAPRIDRIVVSGTRRVDPRAVRSRMTTMPGDRLDLEVLRADLRRIWQIGEFQQVDFDVVPAGDETHLVIDAEDKTWGPNYLRFGLNLEADFEGRGEFTVLADFTKTQVNRYGAEWKGVATVGDTDSLFGEFFQPLGFGGFAFVAPRVSYVHDQRRFLDDATGVLVDADVETAGGGLDVGVQFRNYGEVRVGARRGNLDSRLDLATGRERRDVELGAWRLGATVDLLDNASFPRRGSLAELELLLSRDSIGGDDVYDRLEARFVRAGSIGRHTLVGSLRYGTDLDSNLPFYDEFTLGGFLNLSGLETDELQGDSLAYLSLVYYRQITTMPSPLGGGLYAGAALEGGNVWADDAEVALDDLRPAFLVFAGADTILGPAYLGYGRADNGDGTFYLFLGRPF